MTDEWLSSIRKSERARLWREVRIRALIVIVAFACSIALVELVVKLNGM